MGIKFFIAIIGITSLFLTGTAPSIFFQKGTVTFYDIGQGDAIHIRTQSGVDILVDAGAGAGTLSQKLTRDMPWYDNTIEVIMPTHFDADHIAGFSQVLDSYKVLTVIFNDQKPETEMAKKLLEKINEKHISIKHMKEGERLKLQGGIEFTFYNTQVEPSESSNDHSITTRLVTPHNTFLLTGDLEAPREKFLIDEKAFLKVNILKVGHHGSKSSSSDVFLDATNPTEAVLSFGLNNKYGHPHKETLDKLNNRKIKPRQTVPEGDITYDL